MSTSSLFSWSRFKQPDTSKEIGDATDTVNRQPTSPEAPSTDSVVTEQPSSQETMKLRGGGAGEVCCGICAGLLCFECCEDCC